MHRIRVYIDNSVISGTQDEEFAEASKRFFGLVRRGEYIVLVSAVTFQELEGAPEAAKRLWHQLPAGSVEEVEREEEVKALAREYVSAGVVGEASMNDALHVAAATVVGADLILSWNFEHIVNFNRIRGFNSVNVKKGYRSMTILSPLEVGDEDQEEDV